MGAALEGRREREGPVPEIPSFLESFKMMGRLS